MRRQNVYCSYFHERDIVKMQKVSGAEVEEKPANTFTESKNEERRIGGKRHEAMHRFMWDASELSVSA